MEPNGRLLGGHPDVGGLHHVVGIEGRRVAEGGHVDVQSAAADRHVKAGDLGQRLGQFKAPHASLIRHPIKIDASALNKCFPGVSE